MFDDPAEIVDHEGHYVETIDRSAFNKVLADVTRARAGLPGSVKVLYNHGMTLNGTPSERFSMPIGVPVDIRAEARGLLTRTRYNDTPLAEEILENIRAGSITASRSPAGSSGPTRSCAAATGTAPTPRGTCALSAAPSSASANTARCRGPPTRAPRSSASACPLPGTLDEDPEPDDTEEEQALPPDGEAAADEPHTP